MEENPLVIRVTEVVPKNYKLHTQEVELGIENYKCFENLKCAKRGVCIYKHESLGAIELREMANAGRVEIVWCEAKTMGKDKLLIGCIYISIYLSIYQLYCPVVGRRP